MSDSTDVPATRASPRRLVLVRHAKAVSDSGGSDRQRVLSDRGRQDASRIGGWLAGRLGRVDVVWTSSAVRAVQTYEAIAARLADAPKPQPRDDLYEAGPDDLFHLVRDADDGTRVLMVVGHNPTVERVQAWLSGDDRGFPAGAVAVIEIDGCWADLQPGDGRLVEFTLP